MRLLLPVSVVLSLLSPHAWSAGLEQAVPMGARHAGAANAAVSSASGALALYFNPAGLGGIQGGEASLNLSPFHFSGSGPFSLGTPRTIGSSGIVPSGGAFASHAVTDRLGVGVGVYVVGGAGPDFGTYDLSAMGAAVNPELSLFVADIETSLGAGYKLTPELSVGVAWRVSKQMGSFKLFDPATMTALSVDGMSGSDFGGIRAGAQYRATDGSWGVGITYRNAVPIDLEGGKLSATDLTTGAAIPGGEDASQSLVLPWQLSFGGDVLILPQWRLLLQYDFANYSANRALPLRGTLGGAAFSQSTDLSWNNANALRVGSELYLIANWPLRFGYVHESAMVPSSLASVFLPQFPGPTHTLTAGSGTALSSSVRLDFGASYTVTAGQGAGTRGGAGDGDYKLGFIHLHTGLSVGF